MRTRERCAVRQANVLDLNARQLHAILAVAEYKQFHRRGGTLSRCRHTALGELIAFATVSYCVKKSLRKLPIRNLESAGWAKGRDEQMQRRAVLFDHLVGAAT